MDSDSPITVRDPASLAAPQAVGALDIVLPGGRRVSIGGTESTAATVHVHRWRALRRLVTGGAMGLAQSYIDGDWDADDLAGAIAAVAANRRALDSPARRWVPLQMWRRAIPFSRPRDAARDIASHYDMGNGFFAAWLDATMSYSAALYDHPDQDLASAQAAKVDALLDRLDARPGQHLLDLGCGWGGLALAAARRGLRVTAVTLSAAQADHVRQSAFGAGLAERVSVHRTDFRDHDSVYDHAASIEMVEAVGEAGWPRYFETLRRSVRPGGRIAFQAIAIEDPFYETYRRSTDFVRTRIFPGGMLPSRAVLREQARRAGLEWRDVSWRAEDYARTLADWRQRFEAAWPDIAAQGFDTAFRRTWRYYLAYCEGGFRAGRITLCRATLSA